MKYCRNCRQNVKLTKHFSWGLFIITITFYFWYWLLLKRKVCPICGARNVGRKLTGAEISNDIHSH